MAKIWCRQTLKLFSLPLHQRLLCSGDQGRPVLTLFTKQNEVCSLCEVAKELLQKYKHQLVVEEVCIDAPGNEDWWDLYQYHIPVFHLNGEYLMKHRINEKLLAKKLLEQS